MFEQHSAFAVHASLSTLHSPPPQRPLKQPSEQQSSDFVQATPSAKQAFVHWMTPDMPVTGSQRPLQHCALLVQSVAGPWHAPPPAPRSAPPSGPVPGAAAPPLHEASSAMVSRQIEWQPRLEFVCMRYRV